MVIVVAVLAVTVVAGVSTLLFWMMTGRITLDADIGRSLHALGPLSVRIAAPPDLVFEQIAAPYLGRAPASVREHLEVLDRGVDLVVAAHHTRLGWYSATTVEAVGFEPPDRVTFRHLRGPVPHAVEEFVLDESVDADGEATTTLVYRGELGIDWWFVGRLLGRRWVVPTWEKTVAGSLEELRSGAEQRAAARARREGRDEA